MHRGIQAALLAGLSAMPLAGCGQGAPGADCAPEVDTVKLVQPLADDLSSVVVAERAGAWGAPPVRSLWWCFQARGCDPLFAQTGGQAFDVEIARSGGSIAVLLHPDDLGAGRHRLWTGFTATGRTGAATVRASGGQEGGTRAVRVMAAAGAPPLPRATIDHARGDAAIAVADSMLARFASTRAGGCRPI